MIAILYIAIIMLMRVVQSTFNKKTALLIPKNAGAYFTYTVYYEGIAAVIALVVFLFELLLGGKPLTDVGKAILFASLSGVALGVSCVLGKYILNHTTMAVSSIFGTAGLLVPSIASIFLYNEKITWYQWLAIAVFIAGVYLLIGSSKKIYRKFTVKTAILLVTNLLLGGTTMLMQKMFGMQVATEGTSNTSFFSFVSFIAASGVVGLALPVIHMLNLKERKRLALLGATAEHEVQESPAPIKEQTAEVAAASEEQSAEIIKQVEMSEEQSAEIANLETNEEISEQSASIEASAAQSAQIAEQAEAGEEQSEPPAASEEQSAQVAAASEAKAEPAAVGFRWISPEKGACKLVGRLYIFGLILAVAVFVINQFATLATPLVPSVVLFTLINGGATIISAIVGAIMYKEKFSVQSIIGLVLAIGALVIIKM